MVMFGAPSILPVYGEGDREAVEGARLTRQFCVLTDAPSVARCARATSPQVGRI